MYKSLFVHFLISIYGKEYFRFYYDNTLLYSYSISPPLVFSISLEESSSDIFLTFQFETK